MEGIEEILLKCGFEKIGRHYSTRGDIRFQLVGNGDLSCVDYKHINYLHQLQNLVFSADNVEL